MRGPRTLTLLCLLLATILVGAPVTTVASAQSCVDMCQEEQDFCEIYRCEKDIRRPSQQCLDGCEQQYIECLELDCGICQEGNPSSEIRYDLIDSSRTNNCNVCFGGSAESTRIYLQRIQTWKRTVTTTQELSDCTTDTQVTTSYLNKYCYEQGGLAPYCPISQIPCAVCATTSRSTEPPGCDLPPQC